MAFFYGVIAVLFIIFLMAYTYIKNPLSGKILIFVSIFLITLSTFLYFRMDNRIAKKQTLIPGLQKNKL